MWRTGRLLTLLTFCTLSWKLAESEVDGIGRDDVGIPLGGMTNTPTSQSATAKDIITKQCTVHTFHTFPQVFIYNASAYDANIGTTPDYNTNGSLRFKTDGSEIVRLGIECRHHKPIKWIFDGDFGSKGFREIHTNCSRSLGPGGFQHPEGYEYLVRYEFEFSDFRSTTSEVFVCQSVGRPCERRVVLTSFNPSNQESKAELLPILNEPLHKEVMDLDKKLKLFGRKKESPYGCLANLTLSADIERIFYDWEPREDYQGPYNILDPQSLDNYFRFVQPQEEECTTYVEEPEDLPCMARGECRYVEHGGRPQALYYVKGDSRRVLKGFFDVTEEERFHFDWEKTDPEDFVFLDAPEEAFAGQEVRVQCHTSPVFFSHGSLIGWNSKDNSSLNFAVWQEEDVFLSETGTRNITGRVQLPNRSSTFEGLPEYLNISCFAPIWNSTGWVTKSQPISLLESSPPSLRISKRVEKDDRFKTSFSCQGFGIPLPTLVIIPPKENLNFTTTYENESNSSITLTVSFTKLEREYEGTYNCVATSLIGTSYELYSLTFPVRGRTSFWKALMIGLGSAVLVFVLLVAGLVGKLVKEKEEYRRKKLAAIREFQTGFRNHEAVRSSTPLQYDSQKYEIPLCMWDLGGTLLGTGAFGKVHKGYVRTQVGKKLVAIKIVNSPSNVEDFRNTLMELTVMSYIGCHENVVCLIAACVENLEKASLLLGVEYCTNGSLDLYLRSRRPLFHSFVKKGKLTLEDVTFQGPYTNIIATANFSTLDLCKWSYQIANGMEFLESKKVLHADLATRNVLITQDKVAKISDFGLSRALFQSSDYTKQSRVQLPWKWMALESLRHLQFSTKSDVWSFGVTLWEIFSLGDVPWAFESWTAEYMDQLEAGRRLACPPYCTDNMFNRVILECWWNEPEDRITFASARQFFEEVIVRLSSSVGSSDDYLSTC